MPTYDYECLSCGYLFELFQQMSENPIKKCPECGKNTAKRHIGAGLGIIFKGSGFYETDYKRNNTAGSGGRSPQNNTEKDSAKKETAEKSETAKPIVESKTENKVQSKEKDKK
ncbi:MAG: zinc ribbon domain-containing protein [Candidatus Omnitrophica bacterium]|nr:zinc ribbon domain-containing protein [Candidatus Omnitrophota bacterium]